MRFQITCDDASRSAVNIPVFFNECEKPKSKKPFMNISTHPKPVAKRSQRLRTGIASFCLFSPQPGAWVTAFCLILILSFALQLSAQTTQPKIIGGTPAPDNAYPWMTAVMFPLDTNPATAQYCGGVLIHPQFVMTAAHCVVDRSSLNVSPSDPECPITMEFPSSIDVAVGITDLAAPGIPRRAVDAIYMHSGFRCHHFEGFFNDIALLKLKQPVANASVIGLLDDPVLETPGGTARVMGWGARSTDENDAPDQLYQVELPIVDNATAQIANPGYLVQSTHLAAGFSAGGKDACIGDSGGPLVVRNADDTEWVSAGIVSFGDGCAKPGKYGFYTRVSSFRQWALGLISPRLIDWERQHGLTSMTLDPDSDGLCNFLEFIHGSNPTQPGSMNRPRGELIHTDANDYYGIRFIEPTDTPEFETRLARKDALPGASWVDAPALDTQVGGATLLGNNLQEVLVRDPQSTTGRTKGFLRLGIRWSETPMLLSVLQPGTMMTGALEPTDFQAGGRRRDEFVLGGLTPGQPVEIIMWGSGFTPFTQLVNATDGAVLFEGDMSGVGDGISIKFTPAIDTRYVLRASTAGTNQFGNYRLQMENF